MIAYYKLASEEFLKVIGLDQDQRTSITVYVNFLRPLIFFGILIVFVSLLYPGTGVPEAVMVALFGLIAFTLFTSQNFYNMIGLGLSEQNQINSIVRFMFPVIISGLMIAVLAFILRSTKS